MSELAAEVAAASELIRDFGEGNISPLVLDRGTVEFTVQATKGAARCKLEVADPAAYPACPSSLSIVEGPRVGLVRLNGLLAKGGVRLATAIARLGRQLGADLEWLELEMNPCGSGDEDEEMASYGADDGGEDGEGDDVLREWSQRLVRVERIEREIEEREAEAGPSSVGNLDALSTKQIFDSKAAFRRLANELEEIFKAQNFSLVAEASGPDGLYTWDVSVGGFEPSSPLAADLVQAGRRFGISSVQLRMVFKRGLHPFYPPSVRLVAPRFQGPMLGAVASHPLFQPSGWDPTVSAREALLVVRSFLQAAGRLDLDSHLNKLAGGGGEGPSAAAYSEAEQLLAQLEALTGEAAKCRAEYDELYRAREAHLPRKDSPAQEPEAKKVKTRAASEGADEMEVEREKGKPAAKVAWNAGVGYGYRDSSNSEVWDAKRAAAVQAARDAEVFHVLSSLAAQLAVGLAPGAGAVAQEDCMRAVDNGCLVPLLIRELHPASFQDMAARSAYYCALLDCTAALCTPCMAHTLTWRGGEGSISGRDLASVVAKLSTQASQFQQVFAQATKADGAAASSSSAAAATGDDEDDLRELRLAERISAVAASVAAAVAGRGGAGEPSPPTEPPAGPEAVYARELGRHRTALVAGIATNHSFDKPSQAESTTPKLRARRVGRELASCESDLPVHAASSIFVVADESKSTLWKALITGPSDTPYEGGCFIFDIYFPEHYPTIPPKVLIRTTGGGRVRFNPNLYDSGKVCLSLLGTWSGKSGENWSADYSNIQQVLNSIQSLILVDEPYYNEPGFERHLDARSSDAYSANIMEQTVRWAMLDQLSHPPAYFKDVIHSHFRLRGGHILGTVARWVTWCREKGHPRHADAINKMLPNLRSAIDKLQA